MKKWQTMVQDLTENVKRDAFSLISHVPYESRVMNAIPKDYENAQIIVNDSAHARPTPT